MHINLEHAQKAIEAARKKAVSLKTQECIAVVDSGANLKAFLRMDDAWVGSIDIAIKKARTACLFAMPTGQLGKLSQPGKPLYGIEHSNNGLITFPGGLPIVDEDGVLVGAIGASGSTVENDQAVAEAGVKVLGVSELPEHPWRTSGSETLCLKLRAEPRLHATRSARSRRSSRYTRPHARRVGFWHLADMNGDAQHVRSERVKRTSLIRALASAHDRCCRQT